MENQKLRVVKADLHSHLRTTSYWQEGDFNRAVDVAQRRLGEGGIFGLVNFSDTRYETFSGLTGYDRDFVGEGKNAVYVPQKDIFIVRGQEVPTQQGHLLVLGLPKDVHLRERRSLEDAIKEARDSNGIIIADHPFYREGIGPCIQDKPELVKQFDAFEVFNGEASLWIPGLTPRHANRNASDFYSKRRYEFKWHTKVGDVVSSDGHSFFELGRCWTALDISPTLTTEASSEKFVNALRESIRNAPHCKGIHSLGRFLYPIRIEYKGTPLRLGALTHLAILTALTLGRKLPKPVRQAIDIQKYYDVPRPENLGQ